MVLSPGDGWGDRRHRCSRSARRAPRESCRPRRGPLGALRSAGCTRSSGRAERNLSQARRAKKGLCMVLRYMGVPPGCKLEISWVEHGVAGRTRGRARTAKQIADLHPVIAQRRPRLSIAVRRTKRTATVLRRATPTCTAHGRDAGTVWTTVFPGTPTQAARRTGPKAVCST